jgi:hypothetical protein
MATNLFLARAEIPLAAVSVASSVAEDATYVINNMFGGNKTDFFRKGVASGGYHTFSVSLASAKTANFLYIGKFKLLKDEGGSTYELYGNSSLSFSGATNVYANGSIGGTTLYGPRSEDLIVTFTESAAYQYWLTSYIAATDYSAPHAKLFFGKAFDTGRDPDEGVTLTRINPGVAQKDPYYRVELNWSGISYANTVLFYTTFVKPRRHQPIILFTTTYHGLLNDHRVLFGRIVDATMPPRVTDYNDITITFEEIP